MRELALRSSPHLESCDKSTEPVNGKNIVRTKA
jgi:hypothetical protein